MNNKKNKILIAEDDKFISRAYTDGLLKAGFEVILVESGNDVLQKIASESPNIILLDIAMPGKNGFDVLAEIKTNEQFKHIPVIIVSNLSQVSDLEKAKKMGATDYIVKSDYSLKELTDKVRHTLAMGQSS